MISRCSAGVNLQCADASTPDNKIWAEGGLPCGAVHHLKSLHNTTAEHQQHRRWCRAMSLGPQNETGPDMHQGQPSVRTWIALSSMQMSAEPAYTRRT